MALDTAYRTLARLAQIRKKKRNTWQSRTTWHKAVRTQLAWHRTGKTKSAAEQVWRYLPVPLSIAVKPLSLGAEQLGQYIQAHSKWGRTVESLLARLGMEQIGHYGW